MIIQEEREEEEEEKERRRQARTDATWASPLIFYFKRRGLPLAAARPDSQLPRSRTCTSHTLQAVT